MRPATEKGQSLAEMVVLTLVISTALVLLVGAFREGAESAARTLTLTILLPIP